MAFSRKSVPSLFSFITSFNPFCYRPVFAYGVRQSQSPYRKRKGELDEFPFTAVPLRFCCVFLSGDAHVLLDDPRNRLFAGGAHNALDFFSFIEKNQRRDSFDSVPLRARGIVINV